MIIVGRVRSALYFLPAFQKALYYSYTITYYYYTYIYYIPGLCLYTFNKITYYYVYIVCYQRYDY